LSRREKILLDIAFVAVMLFGVLAAVGGWLLAGGSGSFWVLVIVGAIGGGVAVWLMPLPSKWT
jgi:hypothetical protein